MARMLTTTGDTVLVNLKQLLGRHVRTNTEMHTAGNKVPVGTLCEVLGVWRGTFQLQTTPCDRCGSQHFLRHVPHRWVSLEVQPSE